MLSTQGPAVWLNYWVQLAQGLAQNAITANQVIIDGVNEPEIAGVRWEPSSGGNAATAVGYGALLLQLWDAVNPILPNALLLFEGTSQYSSQGEWGRHGILALPLQLWEAALSAPVLQVHAAGERLPGWGTRCSLTAGTQYPGPQYNDGGGIASQPSVLAQYPGISDPGPPFFEPLLSRPYINQASQLLWKSTWALLTRSDPIHSRWQCHMPARTRSEQRGAQHLLTQHNLHPFRHARFMQPSSPVQTWHSHLAPSLRSAGSGITPRLWPLHQPGHRRIPGGRAVHPSVPGLGLP